MDITKENKRKLIGAGATILFHTVVLLLLLAFGLPYQDPPPPEIGVEMSADDLTEAEDGFAGRLGGGETTDEPTISSNNDDEPSITQNTENVPLTAKPTKKKPKIQPKETEPQVDENALFSKGKVKKGGSGKGDGGGDGQRRGAGEAARGHAAMPHCGLLGRLPGTAGREQQRRAGRRQHERAVRRPVPGLRPGMGLPVQERLDADARRRPLVRPQQRQPEIPAGAHGRRLQQPGLRDGQRHRRRP